MEEKLAGMEKEKEAAIKTEEFEKAAEIKRAQDALRAQWKEPKKNGKQP